MKAWKNLETFILLVPEKDSGKTVYAIFLVLKVGKMNDNLTNTLILEYEIESPI